MLKFSEIMSLPSSVNQKESIYLSLIFSFIIIYVNKAKYVNRDPRGFVFFNNFDLRNLWFSSFLLEQ